VLKSIVAVPAVSHIEARMRKVILFLAKAAITLALLYFAVGRANFAILGDRLSQLDPGWILAALAIVALQTLLLAIRWRGIALLCRTELTLARAFEYTVISIFFGQVMPSTVGGDAVRVWLLARRGAAGWSEATYSVLIDRFVGMLGLAVMVVACLPWSLALIRDPVARNALLLIGFGSTAAAAAFIALGNINSVWLQRWWPTRHLQQLAVRLQRLLFFSMTGLRVLIISLLCQVLTAAITWSVAHATATPFEFGQALLLIPPIILISTIPISIAGWGVRETALVLAFGYAGLPQSDALIVSLLFGATMFAFGVIGGGVWLVSGLKLRPGPVANEKPSPSPQRSV
jgi:glycosyltransferase 2 family protein